MNRDMIGPGEERDGVPKSNPCISLHPRGGGGNERRGINVKGEWRAIAFRGTGTNETDERLNIYIVIRASIRKGCNVKGRRR
jgi:hypothetical protein